MSTEDDSANEPGGDVPGDPGQWDRMSVNSLRRELEVQKEKTAQVRDDAKERREDGGSTTPWGKIIGFSVLGLAVVGGLVFGLRALMPSGDDWSVPDYTQEPHDAGSLADYMREHPAATFDSGPLPDAGVRPHHTGRHRRHHGDDTAATPTEERPSGLEFGGGDDPLGGVLGQD